MVVESSLFFRNTAYGAGGAITSTSGLKSNISAAHFLENTVRGWQLSLRSGSLTAVLTVHTCQTVAPRQQQESHFVGQLQRNDHDKAKVVAYVGRPARLVSCMYEFTLISHMLMLQ